MKIGELIQRWYRLASGDNISRDDAFFKFIAIWVAFNALYTSFYTSRRPRLPGDRSQVTFFSENSRVARNRHRELIRDDEEYQAAISYLRGSKVYDTSYRFEPQEINDQMNLKEVLLYVYQIRNNLFHGGKMPGNPRDEHLAYASYVIVSKLIASHLTWTEASPHLALD